MKILPCIFALILLTSSLQASDLTASFNNMNIGRMSQDFLGYQYDSHGCFHFFPSDIYILYNIIPDGAVLQITPYQNGAQLKSYSEIPLMSDKITGIDELNYYKNLLSDHKKTKIIAEPSSQIWIIYSENNPILRIKTLPGPEKYYNLAYSDNEKMPAYDPSQSKATTPGIYYIWGRKKNFFTWFFENTTVIPMRAKIQKTADRYVYYNGGNTPKKLPDNIQKDLKENYRGQFTYNYFDIKRARDGQVIEAYWGSHDFGEYVVFWSKDKKQICNEMGYAAGEIYYEQIVFIKDLAKALCSPRITNTEDFLKQFSDYDKYKKLTSFFSGDTSFYLIDRTITTYIKLLTQMKVSYEEWNSMPSHLRAAYKLYYFPKETSLTTDEINGLTAIGLDARRDLYKIYGLERELFLYKIAFDKILLKFYYLTNNWDYFKGLHDAIYTDTSLKYKTTAQKTDIIEKALMKRYMLGTVKKEDLR